VSLDEATREKLRIWAKAKPSGPCPSRFISLAEWAEGECARDPDGLRDPTEFSPAAQSALARARAAQKSGG
jgi:hypothetical protein